MISLFLGAGFSKWDAQIPVANQLFDFNIKPYGVREIARLELIKKIKTEWDKLNPNSNIEQFISYSKNLDDKTRTSVLWYITRRISENFIWYEFHSQTWRRHVLMFDENRKYKIEGVVKANSFLKQFYNPYVAGIITTNYDLLIEYTMGTKLFNYGINDQTLAGRGPYPLSQWRNPVRLKGIMPVAKIHGSISWDEVNYYTDGRRGLTGNALIIAPSPGKHVTKSLEFVWNLAERILSKSTYLLVFGFAFNPYDKDVLSLLSLAGKEIKSVLIVDVLDRSELASNLWPNAIIKSIKPTDDMLGEIRKWKSTYIVKKGA